MSLKAAAREREPWLIMASPELEAPSARQLVKLYARRMQIELGFRDVKSHRYGQGLEDSLTRQGARLQILLLVSTLASFVSWLASWLRGQGDRSMAAASPNDTQALLNDACRPRSIGQAMAAGTGVEMAGSHAIVAASSPESDDAGGLRTWGNLRT